MATYSPNTLTFVTEQTGTAVIQLASMTSAGALASTTEIQTATLPLTGPGSAVGTATPASVLADGSLRTATVVFNPVLDSFGNALPDGATVLATATNCGGRTSANVCIASAGGQITNGTTSPNTGYKVLTVQNGTVTATYGDQNLTSNAGQNQIAAVALVPATSTGAVASTTALGSVTVTLAGMTSATVTPNPSIVYAGDGGDHRTTITVTNLRDSAGQPIPDGANVGVSAVNCASRHADNSCVTSYGGVIVGGTTASNNTSFKVFPIVNGQMVFEYSAQVTAIASGEQNAVIQLVPAKSDNTIVSTTVMSTGTVVLSAGSGTVASTPATVLADGIDRRTQIVVSHLVDLDGSTPIPDGTRVGVTVGNCTAPRSFRPASRPVTARQRPDSAASSSIPSPAGRSDSPIRIPASVPTSTRRRQRASQLFRRRVPEPSTSTPHLRPAPSV